MKDICNWEPEGVRDEYFLWLLDQAGLPQGYLALGECLQSIKFRWTVKNDDNRATDGMGLRDKFAFEMGLDSYPELSGPCSVLEMLVALAQRCDIDVLDGEKGAAYWFQRFLTNLDLMRFSDERLMTIGWDETEVDTIVDRWLDRAYSESGEGGMFPLKKCTDDQRKVEIWYQMSHWLLENYV